MEIRFCDQCDASIPEADIDRGVSALFEGKLLCSLCLPRSRHRRLVSLSLYPLSLLAAVAMGAGLSVWLLTPRIDALSSQLKAVKLAEVRRPSVDPSVVKALQDLGCVDAALSEVVTELRSGILDRDGEVSAVLEDLSTKLTVLADEAREVREYLARAATVSVPAVKAVVPPAPRPEAVPQVDVETWLPLTADDDPGVRLSALVALEPVRDDRVLAAARTALTDSDPVVKAQAAKMVGDRMDDASVPDLIVLLMDHNARVRVVSHRALETIAGLDLEFEATDSEEARRGAAEAIRKTLLR
jgi:HEAT repeats